MVRKDEPLQMRIGEAKQRDVGKKRARIGPDAMDYLKVTPGDVIEISGRRSSCAIVWPADEDEKFPDIIKIDGQTRRNIAAAVNDIVKIKKVTTKVAKSVVLMPVNDVVTVDKEFTDFVKNRLKGHPGGPYNKIPLCGSIPKVLKSSGCLSGSSTISLIAFISVPRPPTSS